MEWTNWKQKIYLDSKIFSRCVDKFFVLGGEPLDQDREQFIELIKFLKDTGKEVWLFTRFELLEIPEEIRSMFDYIKTGRYKPEYSSDDHVEYGVQLATKNQHIHKKGVHY